MDMDTHPSEEDYISDEDLEEIKEEIRTAWEVYNELQQTYTRQTGKEYQWFK